MDWFHGKVRLPFTFCKKRHFLSHAIYALHSVPFEAIWEVGIAVGFVSTKPMGNLYVIDTRCLQARCAHWWSSVGIQVQSTETDVSDAKQELV
jgi:hypothetical protein